MAKQTINLGSSPNAKDGDLIRDAFNKVNQNFDELYALNGGTSADLQELAQDYAASMFVNGTHSNVTVNYDDDNNRLNLVVPTIPTDISDLTDNTNLIGSTSLTVITPDDTELSGISTLVFTGTGVTASSVGNAVTLDITGSGATTGNFTFTGGTASLPLGDILTLQTYENGGNRESVLSLAPTGDSALDVGGGLRVRTAYGTGFEKSWTFNTNGSVTFPDSTIQTTAWPGTDGIDGLTVVQNNNVTEISKTLTEASNTVTTRIAVAANQLSLTSVADPDGLNNNSTGSVVVDNGGVIIDHVNETLLGNDTGSVLVTADGIQLAHSVAGGAAKVIAFSNGNVTYPGNITQSHQSATICNPGVDTVVYTATAQFQHAIKLFVMVEGLTDGGGTSWDTQACDVIAVRGYNNNIVHVTTYGVTYSGATAIATFDGQWNATTNRIEITCTPVSATNAVYTSVHAIEIQSND